MWKRPGSEGAADMEAEEVIHQVQDVIAAVVAIMSKSGGQGYKEGSEQEREETCTKYWERVIEVASGYDHHEFHSNLFFTLPDVVSLV